MRLNQFTGPATNQTVSTLPRGDTTPTTQQDRSSGKTVAPVERKAPKCTKSVGMLLLLPNKKNSSSVLSLLLLGYTLLYLGTRQGHHVAKVPKNKGKKSLRLGWSPFYYRKMSLISLVCERKSFKRLNLQFNDVVGHF